MSVTDPLADMFTVIRNAVRANLDTTEFPCSKFKLEILNILKREGYIKNYKQISDNKQGRIKVYLRFKKKGHSVLTNIKRISRPGLKVYVSKHKVPKVLGGLGTAVLSTSSGIVTDAEARKQGLGGEVLCYIW